MCSGFREYAVAEIEYVKIGAPAHDTLIILWPNTSSAYISDSVYRVYYGESGSVTLA